MQEGTIGVYQQRLRGKVYSGGSESAGLGGGQSRVRETLRELKAQLGGEARVDLDGLL